MTTPSLIDWLRDALDEDERLARGAIVSMGDVGEWSYVRSRRSSLAAVLSGPVPVADRLRDQDAAHIATWDPDRVLAEVQSKRKHIERYEHVDRLLADAPDPSHIRNELLSVRRAYLLVLQDDAEPYRSRPGFREEWL